MEYEDWNDLYVHMFSYDCGGRPYCTQIPTTDSTDDPIAVDKTVGFSLVGRAYLDPATGVRPLEDELVIHRVFEGLVAE